MSTTGIEKFKGENLQNALNARRWSVADLSEYTGVSAPMIYHLLNNTRKPSYETIQQIASSTNFKISYFLRENKVNYSHAFFRKFTSSTKKRRDSIIAQLNWVIELKELLSKYVEFPKYNIPDFDLIKEKGALNLTLDDVENLAINLRSYWDLGSYKIDNISDVFESNGITITKFLFDTIDIDALSKFDSENNSAFVVLSQDKKNRSRTRFDLAHELGHCLMHKFLDPKKIDLTERETHRLLEKQANRFAGAFLIPQDSIAKDFSYPTLESYKNLKVKYGVSIAFLIFRTHQLDLINDGTYKNLQINLSRKKWKTLEPLEDKIPEEKPTLLKSALLLVLDENVLNIGEIENLIGLNKSDLERITGLENNYLKKYDSNNSGPKLRLAK